MRVVLAALSGCFFAAAGSAQTIDVSVPHVPSLVMTTGGRALIYEVFLRTRDSTEVPPIHSVVVTDASTGAVLQRLFGASLDSAHARNHEVIPPTAVTGRDRTALYMWVPLTLSTPPAALRHVFELGSGAAKQNITLARTEVNTSLLVLGPPFADGAWLAGNTPFDRAKHRRFIFSPGPTAWLAQRYAIDFTGVAADGSSFKGDSSVNANWQGYGSGVIAVAAGVIAAVKDDVPENVPGSGTFAVRINAETGAGNHVILDLGNQRYVLYGHLRPGSIRVRAGDRVRRGQVLGEVGNSGGSSGPHLHLQVTNKPATLAADGVAYVFESFKVLGTCDDVTCARTQPREYKRLLPRSPELITFVR